MEAPSGGQAQFVSCDSFGVREQLEGISEVQGGATTEEEGYLARSGQLADEKVGGHETDQQHREVIEEREKQARNKGDTHEREGRAPEANSDAGALKLQYNPHLLLSRGAADKAETAGARSAEVLPQASGAGSKTASILRSSVAAPSGAVGPPSRRVTDLGTARDQELPALVDGGKKTSNARGGPASVSRWVQREICKRSTVGRRQSQRVSGNTAQRTCVRFEGRGMTRAWATARGDHKKDATWDKALYGQVYCTSSALGIGQVTTASKYREHMKNDNWKTSGTRRQDQWHPLRGTGQDVPRHLSASSARRSYSRGAWKRPDNRSMSRQPKKSEKRPRVDGVLWRRVRRCTVCRAKHELCRSAVVPALLKRVVTTKGQKEVARFETCA